MVFESLKKMLGRGGDKDEKSPPPKPVLEQGSSRSTSRQDLGIPDPDDVNDLPSPGGRGGPEGPPSPQSGRGGRGSVGGRRQGREERSRSRRGQRGQSSGSIPRNTGSKRESLEPRRPQRESRGGRGQRRKRSWEAPDKSHILAERERDVKERRRGEGDSDSIILDHLDRIENRLEDIDRRLSMLESRYRLRQ